MATFFNSYQIFAGSTFHRYRLFSLALSALLIRHWKKPEDRLLLVTDESSKAFFDASGISSLYDDIFIPPEIVGVDPHHFFALIKLRGIASLPAPICSIDWDLFPLHREVLEGVFKSDSCALHYECLCGPAYVESARLMKYVPGAPELENGPINCGILGFASQEKKDRYCGLVFDFMRRYSKNPILDRPPHLTMMFAEQALLGHLGNSNLIYDRVSTDSFRHLWGEKLSLDENKIEGNGHCDWVKTRLDHLGICVPGFLDSTFAQALP